MARACEVRVGGDTGNTALRWGALGRETADTAADTVPYHVEGCWGRPAGLVHSVTGGQGTPATGGGGLDYCVSCAVVGVAGWLLMPRITLRSVACRKRRRRRTRRRKKSSTYGWIPT